MRCQNYIINLVIQAFLFKDIFKIENIKSYKRNEVIGKKLKKKEKRKKKKEKRFFE
jgi:hypothetical protein